ncbi:HGxxPAAW family protein [Streptomyces sp. V3I7]|uniref:HGxxPAAW family protein n=1 Tax=Streptomyces sp. V3I7 TaxID=3042278 RepID=UPI00278B47F0|nr:HGxxPAAW family protein [Streptomyces sp. V3I7]MDQ0991790.1 hypothetical protein [Streptomyces sp. V3I7]
MSGHLHDEGHTIAGWTGFLIGTVGSTVAGGGVVMASPLLISGGLAIVAVAVLVTWALHLAGWGKPPGPRPRDTWNLRSRDRAARQGHPGCVGCRLAGRASHTTTAVQPVADTGESQLAAADAGV